MASPLAQALAFQQSVGAPPQTQIQPTDVLGAYKLSQDAKQKQYEAQVSQQNAMYGGLASLGGAALSLIPGVGPFAAMGLGAAKAAGGMGGMGQIPIGATRIAAPGEPGFSGWGS